MLEKYLNKNVVIQEKIYAHESITASKISTIEGVITAIDDEFVEVDNKMLIARKFIYRIILK